MDEGGVDIDKHGSIGDTEMRMLRYSATVGPHFIYACHHYVSAFRCLQHEIKLLTIALENSQGRSVSPSALPSPCITCPLSSE